MMNFETKAHQDKSFDSTDAASPEKNSPDDAIFPSRDEKPTVVTKIVEEGFGGAASVTPEGKLQDSFEDFLMKKIRACKATVSNYSKAKSDYDLRARQHLIQIAQLIHHPRFELGPIDIHGFRHGSSL